MNNKRFKKIYKVYLAKIDKAFKLIKINNFFKL